MVESYFQELLFVQDFQLRHSSTRPTCYLRIDRKITHPHRLNFVSTSEKQAMSKKPKKNYRVFFAANNAIQNGMQVAELVPEENAIVLNRTMLLSLQCPSYYNPMQTIALSFPPEKKPMDTYLQIFS